MFAFLTSLGLDEIVAPQAPPAPIPKPAEFFKEEGPPPPAPHKPGVLSHTILNKTELRQELYSIPLRQQFINSFETFVFDCDGVLWDAETIIPGVVEFLQMLMDARRKVVFVTNNSTRNTQHLKDKCLRVGIPPQLLEDEHSILSSASVSALYMKTRLPHIKKVYVIGADGLCDELAKVGVQCVGGPDDSDKRFGDSQSDGGFLDIVNMINDENNEKFKGIEAVICGSDTGFNYYKICVAAILIQNGAKYISTNSDEFMMQDGYRRPGNGSLNAVIRTTTGVEPITLGKPSDTLAEVVTSLDGVVADKTCMVGDRMNTDILFGKLAKFTTLLVLTGCTTREQLEGLDIQGSADDAKICPHFFTNSLDDFNYIGKEKDLELNDPELAKEPEPQEPAPVVPHGEKGTEQTLIQPSSTGAPSAVKDMASEIEAKVAAEDRLPEDTLWEKRAGGVIDV